MPISYKQKQSMLFKNYVLQFRILWLCRLKCKQPLDLHEDTSNQNGYGNIGFRNILSRHYHVAHQKSPPSTRGPHGTKGDRRGTGTWTKTLVPSVGHTRRKLIQNDNDVFIWFYNNHIFHNLKYNSHTFWSTFWSHFGPHFGSF